MAQLIAPAQGRTAAPVAVASGTVSTIPFPSDVQGSSQPWRTPWVVLLNSSPFTLVVATGAQVTQIAAFTSDKVFVFAQGTSGPAVTVTPSAGSGTPNPASDSTVYATWYETEPPGNYPASLGSGSVSNVFNSQVVNNSATLTAGNSTTFGNFPTTGYGGVAVAVTETSSNGPVVIQCTWFSSPGLLQVAQRVIVCPAGGSATFSLPNLGPQFSFAVLNNNGAVSITYTAIVGLTPFATASWTPLNSPLIVAIPGTATPFGTLVVQGAAGSVYAGPAMWFHDWSTCTAGTFALEYQNGAGTWQAIYGPRITAAISAGELGLITPVLLPPNPVRIRFWNQQGAGSITPSSSLIVDDWRVAA